MKVIGILLLLAAVASGAFFLGRNGSRATKRDGTVQPTAAGTSTGQPISGPAATESASPAVPSAAPRGSPPPSPSPSPSPSPTPSPTPAPPTMAVGQAVTAGSLRLTLTDESLLANGVAFHYQLTNINDHDISVRVNNMQFSAQTPSGRPLTIVEGLCDGSTGAWDKTFVLHSNESNPINPYCGSSFIIFIDTSIATNKEVVAIVTNLGDIVDARWALPIQH